MALKLIFNPFTNSFDWVDSITPGLNFMGSWDAQLNNPDLVSLTPSLNKNNFWVVTVAGTTNLGGIAIWNIGDWAVCTGTGWIKVDNVVYANRNLSNLQHPTSISVGLYPDSTANLRPLGGLGQEWSYLSALEVKRSSTGTLSFTTTNGNIDLFPSGLSAVVQVYKHVVPDLAASKNLGTATKSFLNLFIEKIGYNSATDFPVNISTRQLNGPGNNPLFDFSSNINLVAYANIKPSTTGKTLGTATTSEHWDNVYTLKVQQATAATDLTLQGARNLILFGVTGAVLPGGSTQTFGSNTNLTHWNTIYTFSGITKGASYPGSTALTFKNESGNLNIQTTSSTASGSLNFTTGPTSGNTGSINIGTGNSSLNSGDIQLSTGTCGLSSTRGKAIINASSLDISSTNIINVLNPVNAQDAATKNFVETTTGPSANWQTIPLLDNIAVPTTFYSYPVTSEVALHQWLVTRSNGVGIDRSICCTQTITDGVSAVGGYLEESLPSPDNTGVVITKTVVGTDVVFQYTSTNTGYNPTIKIKPITLG